MPAILMAIGWRVKIVGVAVVDSLIERMVKPKRDRRNFAPLHLWLIRVIGVIVPQRLRADWRQELEAELRHRELLLAAWNRLDWHSKLDLQRRSVGASWDALPPQPQR